LHVHLIIDKFTQNTTNNIAMSRRIHPTSNEQKAVSCHVCQKAGESSQMVTSHNFRDHKGRVACPFFVEKIMSKQCIKPDKTSSKEEMKVTLKPVKKEPSNRWDALVQESSDDETFAKIAPNVTVRRKIKASQRNWADDSDDEY